MKFPFEAHTRAGSEVTITGYFTGYDRPWCGFYDVELEDAKFKQPLTWNDNGGFSRNPDTETSLDLIDLPVPQ
jgi:hypothetical protein